MNLLMILTLSTALLFIELMTYPSSVHSDEMLTSDPDLDRPIRYVETLEVNTLNVERYVANDKCEFQGILEIRKLLTRSRFEEMWIYLPRAQSLQRCQWHEIGRNESSTQYDAYVSVDRAYLDEIISKHKEVHIYHFHPSAYFECVQDKTCNRRPVPNGADDFSMNNVISDLRFSMPSPNDVHFMMDATWQFHQHHARNGRIRHRVITPYGIVDYALTESGKVKYESDKDSRTQGLYIKWVAASALTDEDIQLIANKNRRDINAALHHLVQSLNTDYLRVAFSPFRRGPE